MASAKSTFTLLCLLNAFSSGLLVPSLESHVKSIGGSHIAVGIITTFYIVAQLVAAPIVGSISGLKGNKIVLLSCLYICGLSTLIFGLSSSILVLLIFKVILGVTNQTDMLVKTMTPFYLTDKDEQLKMFGRYISLTGLSMALGPFIGKKIMETSPEHGFIIISLIIGVAYTYSSVLVKRLPDVPYDGNDDEDIKSKNVEVKATKGNVLDQSIDELFKVKWSAFIIIFLLEFLMMTSLMMYKEIWKTYLTNDLEVSPKYLGYISAVQAITGSITNNFIVKFNKKYPNDHAHSQRNLHMYSVAGLSLVGMIVAPNIYIFMIFLIPLAVCSSLSKLIRTDMLVTRSNSSHMGIVFGFSNSVWLLATVISPVLASVLVESFGISYVFYVGASFTGFGGLLSYLLGTKSKQN